MNIRTLTTLLWNCESMDTTNEAIDLLIMLHQLYPRTVFPDFTWADNKFLDNVVQMMLESGQWERAEKVNNYSEHCGAFWSCDSTSALWDKVLLSYIKECGKPIFSRVYL